MLADMAATVVLGSVPIGHLWARVFELFRVPDILGIRVGAFEVRGWQTVRLAVA